MYIHVHMHVVRGLKVTVLVDIMKIILPLTSFPLHTNVCAYSTGTCIHSSPPPPPPPHKINVLPTSLPYDIYTTVMAGPYMELCVCVHVCYACVHICVIHEHIRGD